MKSSNKILRRADALNIEAWQPAALFSAEKPQAEIQEEEILAIFHPSEDILPKTIQKQGHFAVWEPQQIEADSAQSPALDWDFLADVASLPENGLVAPYGRFARQTASEQQQNDLLAKARAQAEEMLINAQAEADKILFQAEEELEEQRKAVLAETQQKVFNEIGATLESTYTLLAEVNNWKKDLIAQGETILVEMLKEIAQKMFGEGVTLNPEALQMNLNRVMESVNRLGDVNVFLNPQDAKVLTPEWSKYQSMVLGNEVKIIPSEKITRGGCYIKGSMGIVDGRVETQLNAMLNALDDAST